MFGLFQDILLRDAEIALAIGAENMSQTPFMVYPVFYDNSSFA